MPDSPQKEQPSPRGMETGSDLTRREWFLRLGESAVLAGFRGIPLEGITSGQAVAKDAALPPGLYDPSEDHMSHALTSDGRFHPVPSGSETDFVLSRQGPFHPQFFPPQEFRAVRRLVELILGDMEKTDEAEEAISEVSEWIDLEAGSSPAVREAARRVSSQHRALITAFHGKDRIGEITAQDPAKVWREGLEWISAECHRTWGKDFLGTPAQSQAELLRSLGSDTAENAGTRLFTLVKAQVIRGFYTSRFGLRELDYKGNAFNPECPGCKLAPKHEG